MSARTLLRVSARTNVLARLLLRTSRIAIVAVAFVCGAGCKRSHTPWLFDAGPVSDGGPAPRRDTDGDGLCDDQEAARGLRVDDPDTDDDGFSDFVEVALGLDPLSRVSPTPDRVIYMRESAEGTARATVTLTVDGAGDSYSGSFTPVSPFFSADGIEADVFFAGAGPVGATPMANVYEIDRSAQAFVGVRGRTLLTYEVLFRFTGEARGCQRAYPFQYTVKRDDGTLMSFQRFTLVITPASGPVDAMRWCGATPCF